MPCPSIYGLTDRVCMHTEVVDIAGETLSSMLCVKDNGPWNRGDDTELAGEVKLQLMIKLCRDCRAAVYCDLRFVSSSSLNVADQIQ